MRYQGGYVRREGHLARLERSARALGHRWRRGAIVRALDEAAAGRDGAWRVRLLLPTDGRPTWQATPMPPPPAEPVAVALAQARIDGNDPWRRHKTTRRGPYDAATLEARRRGLADLLFLDRHGFVVEGAVSTVFVAWGDRVLTPPVERGALPGVLRAELLDCGWAEEGDVSAHALESAERIWIGSSLRDLRRARIVSS